MVKTLHLLFIAVCTYAFTGIMLSTIQGSGATNVAFRVELAAVTIYMVVAAATYIDLATAHMGHLARRIGLLLLHRIGELAVPSKGTWRHITQPS